MPRSSLHFLGIAVLVLGLASVALIERNIRILEASSLEDTEATHALLHPEDYGAYARNAELMGGKFAVLMDAWWEQLLALGHSRTFAMVIAAASLATAAALFSASSFSRRS